MRAAILPLLLLFGLLVAVPVAVGAPAEVEVRGDTPVLTTAAVSADAFPDGAIDVVLVSAGGGAVEGVAGPVLARHLGAPLLASDQETLTPGVRAEIERLEATTVHLMGGQAALSAEVEDELQAMGLTTLRYSGPTRYETAVSVSKTITPWGESADVVVGLGTWPDVALAATSEAVRTDAMMLLVTYDQVHDLVRQEIHRLAPGTITIVGSTDLIGPEVEAELRTLAPTVVRVPANRQQAAMFAVAQRGGGIAGRELTVAPSAGGYSDLVPTVPPVEALAALGAYHLPFLYADADPVIEYALEQEEPALLRKVGNARTEFSGTSEEVPAGGIYQSAAEAEPDRPAVVIIPGTGGTVSSRVVETTVTVDGTIPVSNGLQIQVPASPQPAAATRIRLVVDLADLPSGTGHGDVTWVRDGTPITEACANAPGTTQIDPKQLTVVPCVGRSGVVGDDLYQDLWVRDGDEHEYAAVVDVLARRAGVNRYETGNDVATQQPLFGTDEVYVATGQEYADALAAAAVAGATGSRVLITPGTGEDPAMGDAITRLGATSASIVGGEQVVADGTVTVPADRLDGPDRLATAATVATERFNPGLPWAFLATGYDFPDALAGAVAAGRANAPMLLTRSTALPNVTREALTTLQPQRVVIVGGDAVVTPAVQAEVEALGIEVVRLEGANRWETAAAISRAIFPQGADVVFLATGYGFADALTGAPVAAQAGGPLLLTGQTSLTEATAAELARLQPRRIVIIGGEAAVSEQIAIEAASYLR